MRRRSPIGPQRQRPKIGRSCTTHSPCDSASNGQSAGVRQGASSRPSANPPRQPGDGRRRRCGSPRRPRRRRHRHLRGQLAERLCSHQPAWAFRTRRRSAVAVPSSTRTSKTPDAPLIFLGGTGAWSPNQEVAGNRIQHHAATPRSPGPESLRRRSLRTQANCGFRPWFSLACTPARRTIGGKRACDGAVELAALAVGRGEAERHSVGP